MAARRLLVTPSLNCLRPFVNVGCSCTRNLHTKGLAGWNIQLPSINYASLNEMFRLSVRPLSLISHITKRYLATKSRKKKIVASKHAVFKPDLKLGPDVMYHELPVVFINATYNNTMFTITDHNGLTVAWTSAGVEGFKGAKRGTNHAAQIAGIAASKKALCLGINRVRVKIRGMGPGRQTSVKGLISGGTEIVSVTDVTPMPHNGCRPPKQRRI